MIAKKTRRKLLIVSSILMALSLVLAATPALAHGRGDRDALPNRWEKAHGLNHHRANARADADHDGLRNLGEFRNHADPRDPDTDDDGLDDHDEVLDFDTNPRDADSDDDGIFDGDDDSDGDGNDDEDEDDSDGYEDSEEDWDDDSEDDGTEDEDCDGDDAFAYSDVTESGESDWGDDVTGTAGVTETGESDWDDDDDCWDDDDVTGTGESDWDDDDDWDDDVTGTGEVTETALIG